MKRNLLLLALPLLCSSVFAQENLLENPGIENGVLTPWGEWGTAVNSTEQRTGNYCIEINTISEWGGGSEYNVSNLKLSTTYVFGGWCKIEKSGEQVRIGAKQYDASGEEVYAIIQTTSYSSDSIEFTTSSSNTTAIVYFYKPEEATAGTGYAYGDDFFLHEKTTTSVTQQLAKPMNLFPSIVNQNTTFITSSFDLENANITIVDLSGRSLYDAKSVTGKVIEIPFGSLSKGILFITIQSNGISYSQKLINQ
jgi:hypothetical protein